MRVGLRARMEMSHAFLADDDAPDDLVPQRQTGRYEPHSPRLRRHRAVCRTPLPIKTRGAIPSGREAWVYVAEGRRGVKIGMTTQPAIRGKQLRAVVHEAIPVVPAMARAVETATLVRLGAMQRDGEWIDATVAEAVAAAHAVMGEYRRMAHVDPHLSADEARHLRIALASGGGLP